MTLLTYNHSPTLSFTVYKYASYILPSTILPISKANFNQFPLIQQFKLSLPPYHPLITIQVRQITFANLSIQDGRQTPSFSENHSLLYQGQNLASTRAEVILSPNDVE